MEHVDRAAASAYTDVVATLLAMPLEPADRAVVVAVIERLAAYAADIASVDFPRDADT
jgi:hypothetical protein